MSSLVEMGQVIHSTNTVFMKSMFYQIMQNPKGIFTDQRMENVIWLSLVLSNETDDFDVSKDKKCCLNVLK